MATTHPGDVLAIATDAVTATLGASPKLVFRVGLGTVASPGAVVATLPMSATGFAAANTTTGIATANAITSDTNAAGNASAVGSATLQTSANVVKIHCAVAASASDINMTNGLTVAAGDTVSCSALTYRAIAA